MRIAINAEDHVGYTRFMTVQEIDEKTLHTVMDKFELYKRQGVIADGSFEDMQWTLTNEVSGYRMAFGFDEVLFRKNASGWIGCTSLCFAQCVKAYIVLLLGELALASLYEINRALIALAGKNMAQAAEQSELHYHLVPFLSLIPGCSEGRDWVMERLEEDAPNYSRSRKQRKLESFRSYLHFNAAMTQFWESAKISDRRTYFPLYLWWNLTSVLPLRVTEFLLLPNDCLRKDGDSHTLSIRRTRLKKGYGNIAYRINADYEIKQYEIPDEMAAAIIQYKESVKNEATPQIGTLFIPKAGHRYFNYAQMRALLRSFCEEVMSEPGFSIRLGDTRHLAMINLILSGGSPVICRELAGHESIDISSGYYANLSSIVECVVYERYHRGTDSPLLTGGSMFSLAMPENGWQTNGGWCDVPEVQQGVVSECVKSYSAYGSLGDCRRCIHFHPNKPDMRMEILKGRKRAVDADGAFLMQMIELVRRGEGHVEDIGSAILRLQASRHRYGTALYQKYSEEGIQNGTT